MLDILEYSKSDETILFRFDNVDCDAKVNSGVVANPEVCNGNFKLSNPKRIQLQLQYWYNEHVSVSVD